MTVVPTGGIDWSALLGSGATEWWGVADAVAPPAVLVAVAAAVADDAPVVGAAEPDEPLLATDALDGEPAAVFEPDAPPHAASSSTSDPSPVAAAHPLLRITSLQFTGMTRPRGARQGSPGEPETRRARAVRPPAWQRWNLRP